MEGRRNGRKVRKGEGKEGKKEEAGKGNLPPLKFRSGYATAHS